MASADDFISELKDAAIDLGVSGVMAYLTLQAPFTRAPIVNKLIEAIVRKVLEIAVKYTELGAYFVYVDHYTAQQAKEFKEASAALEAAKKLGNADEIAKAKQAKIDMARKLIKLAR